MHAAIPHNTLDDLLVPVLQACSCNTGVESHKLLCVMHVVHADLLTMQSKHCSWKGLMSCMHKDTSATVTDCEHSIYY